MTTLALLHALVASSSWPPSRDECSGRDRVDPEGHAVSTAAAGHAATPCSDECRCGTPRAESGSRPGPWRTGDAARPVGSDARAEMGRGGSPSRLPLRWWCGRGGGCTNLQGRGDVVRIRCEVILLVRL